jgi:predicted transposase YbfD/YdcC
MAGKKGVFPLHVKKKHFDHPGIEYPLIQLLEKVEDPRGPSLFFRYSLTSILFMTLVGVICGATDWPKVVVIAQGLAPWLSNYVDMTPGVPCERTFKNLINALSPEALESVLRELAKLMRGNSSRDVISFDGQTCRGTSNKPKGLNGIHLLNAWSSESGICIGQIKVDDKSNEITAVPDLMDVLDLKGTVITVDALNTQKTIADKAVEKGGDYLLPVKGNQSGLQEAIVSTFEVAEKERTTAIAQHERAIEKAKEHRDKTRLKKLLARGVPNCGMFSHNAELEKSHGRIEIRRCLTLSAKELPMRGDWRGISSLVQIDRERIVGDKVSHERVYYISSLTPDQPAFIADVARSHWGVESSLHWRLDVVFRQDQSRYRNRNGARNLAAMRKIVLNAFSRENSIKGGMATRQFAAACNPAYRDRIVKNLF